MLPVYCVKCLSRKAVHNWVEKFSQGCSKIAGDVRPGLTVDTVTEAIVHRVEELSRADRKITIDSDEIALGCSHGLVYSILHDCLTFRKVYAWWVPRDLMDREEMNHGSVFATSLTVCR
jgi:hypothetical protein